MSNVGFPELLILLVVVLLVFGPNRLPEMGRSLGRGMREFRDAISGNARPDTRDVGVEGAAAESAAAAVADTSPDTAA
jgi:sec-independent protein translocase protein TatA